MIFSLKLIPIYVILGVMKDFFMSVTTKPKINTMQTKVSKNLAKSALWSYPYKVPISVLLIRKTIKLIND